MRGGGGRMGGSRGGSGRGLGATGGRGGMSGGAGPRGGGFGPAGPGFGGFGGGPRMGWGHSPRGGFGFGWGGGFRRRRGFGFGGPSFSIIIVIIVLAIVSTAIPQNQNQGRGVTPSTVNRTALPRGSAGDTVPMLTDHLGWIGNQARLLPGMRNFFDRTGVRPHLYLVGEIYGTTTPNNAQLQSFAEARYSELFVDDEAHALLLFFENFRGQYGMWVTTGNQARSVIDDEAVNILMDFVQRHYSLGVNTPPLGAVKKQAN